MGLLDSGPLSSPEAQIALAAGLLGGRGNFGANLGQGLLGAVATQQQERANRASDLQQLSGAYQMLKQQEFAKMLAAKQSGQPYFPNPMLPQMEQRIAQLTGLPNLSGQGPVSSVPQMPPQLRPQSQAPSMPAQGNPAPAAPAQGNPAPIPSMPAQGNPAPMSSMPPQSSPFGGPALGIDPLEFMSVDPSGKSYMDALIKQATPIPTRFGVYGIDPRNPAQVRMMGGMIPKDALPVDIGPDGKPRIQALPGQIDTQSALAEASTRGAEIGKFPGRVENVTLANGATVPQLLSNVVGNPYTPGAQKPALSATPASKVAQVTVTEPSKQAQAVPQPNSDPWATVPKRPIPQGIGQSSYDAAMSKLQADTASKLAEKYGANADTAQNRIALNNQALELVDRADTGMGAATLGDVKNLLVSRFGIPESDFKNDPAATAALNKDLMNAAVAKAKASFGARMSTNEVNNMLKRGAPNGDMLASAIKFLLSTDNATAQYQIQQANNLGKYLSVGGDPLQFEAWHAKTFPLSKTLDQMHLPQNTPANNNPGYGWKVERVQ